MLLQYAKILQNYLQKLTKHDSGGTVVGGTGCYRNLNMPFGGHKMSGIGGEGFSVTLNEMSKIKSLVIKGLIK